MTSIQRLAKVIVLSALMCLVSSASFAQSDGYVTTSNTRGLAPLNTFQVGDIDNINLANGAVNLHIPLFTRKGRGVDTERYFDYSSKLWIVSPQWDGVTHGLDGIQWKLQSRYNQNVLSSPGGRLDYSEQVYDNCTYINDNIQVSYIETDFFGFIYHGANGESYRFPNNHLDISDPNAPGDCAPIDITDVTASDSGGMLLDTTQKTSYVLYHPNGDKEVVHGSPYLYTDHNGNEANTTQDTLNRTTDEQITQSSTNPVTTETIKDSNGNSQSYVIAQELFPLAASFPTTVCGAVPIYNPVSNSFLETSTITLPNQLQYVFEYHNDFGEISKITLPAGGYIRYEFVTIPRVDNSPSWGTSNCPGVLDSRRVSVRAVSATGNPADEKVWQYSYAGDRANGWTTTVIDPLGNKTVHHFGGLDQTHEVLTEYFQGTSTLVKTVATAWQNNWGVALSSSKGPNTGTFDYLNWLPTTVTTTLTDVSPNLIKRESTTYDSFTDPLGQPASRGDVKTHTESDWGSGGVGSTLRSTSYSYLHESNATYASLNIVDRVSNKTVFDKNNNLVAQTQYEYDVYSPPGIAASGATQHDASYGTGYTTRGNVTATLQWRNTDGAWLTTRNQYDDAGNVLSSTDPRGHSTSFSFADAWGNGSCSPSGGSGAAYATRVTDPMGHSVTATFNSCTGTTASQTDPNSQTTAYSYDALDRLTQETRPAGGGQTSYCYSDIPGSPCYSALPLHLNTTTSIAAGVNLTTTDTVDGLGRAVKHQLTSDPDGTTTTDTGYDALGRVSDASNPYRGVSTDGNTRTDYDELGRVLSITRQDGSVVGYQYAGQTTTVTDEAGIQRKTYSDGLGRLVRVDEPAPTVEYPSTAAAGYVDIGGSEQNTTCCASAATPGSGSVTINGSLQSKQIVTQAATHATATVTISGQEQHWIARPCIDSPCSVYDSGSVSITTGGVRAFANFGSSSTDSSLATALTNAINGNSSYPATATLSGSTITLLSKGTGAAANLSLSVYSSWNTTYFTDPSFSGQPSGSSLTGGQDAVYGTLYDSGTASITVNGYGKSTSYGAGDTNATIASRLASAFNNDPGAPVSASASSNVVYLTSKVTGVSSNYSLTAGGTYDTVNFAGPSFGESPSGSALTGGSDGTPPQTIYDAGTVQITVNGEQHSVNYGSGSTASGIASALAGAFTASPSVLASASGTRVTFASITTGASTNYSLSAGSSTSQGGYFAQPSFSTSPSGGTLTGGSDAHPGGGLIEPWTTLYTYDALDNLLSVEQQGGVGGSSSRNRSFTYDSLGHLLTAHNPESNTICYGTWSGQPGTTCMPGYDDDGLLTHKSDYRSITVSYSYDSDHHLTGKTYTNDAAVAYNYNQTSANGLAITNGIDRRTSMSDASGTTAWSYDAMGRVGTEQRTIAGITKSLGYTYNYDGSPATITYPSGRVVTYVEGGAGRPLSATDNGSGVHYFNNAHYVASGGLQSADAGSAVHIFDAYNSRLQPCRLSATTGTPPTDCTDPAQGNVLDLAYDFHAGSGDNGDVFTLTNNRDTTRTQAFTYDQLNRLATAETPNANLWGNSYTYDAWGNLLQKTVTKGTAESLSVTVNTNNQLIQAGYDPAGNTTSYGSTTFNYDDESRIKGGGGVTYMYDGDGNRVEKSNGTLYWGAGPLAETDLSGNVTNEYVFVGGKRVARVSMPSGAAYYYFEDELGTSRIITDSTGTVCYDADYFPWGGEQQVYVNTCPQNYKFTGKERDGETGLDYFGARFYGSTMGRFLSTDEFTGGPVDVFSSADPSPPGPLPYGDITIPQSLNKYSYTLNNPLRYIDPDGHCTSVLDCAVLVGTTVSGAAAATYAAGAAALGSLVALAVEEVKSPLNISSGGSRFGIGAEGGATEVMMRQDSKASATENQEPAAATKDNRPAGVPEHWDAKPTKKGGGTEYVNPENPHDRVRDMPGNPKSSNPAQREPYVKWQKNGQPLDKDGNPVKGTSPEAHIPRKDFKYKEQPR